MTAPGLLIHLHLPKTGGSTLNGMIKRGFKRDEMFQSTLLDDQVFSGLGVATYESCERSLRRYELNHIRYLSGHVPYGVHRIFNRPAQYISVVRHPVERVLSYFFFGRQIGDPYLKNGRWLSLEEYVENQRDIILNDHQTRVISGCPDLDAKAGPCGAEVIGAPVQAHHLDQAKRNVENSFLAIASLEQLTELALMVRTIYGWPMRRLHNDYKNPTKGRPRLADIAPHLIKIIERCNAHDIELYEWAGKRFAEQRQLFEPGLSKDRRIYGVVNRVLNTAGRLLPRGARRKLAETLFYR